MFYEIQDESNVFFRTHDLLEALKIYDTNWMKEKFYIQKYGSKKEDKYKLTQFTTRLKLVAIIESVDLAEGKVFHYNPDSMG